jgi:hypothetical protein
LKAKGDFLPAGCQTGRYRHCRTLSAESFISGRIVGQCGHTGSNLAFRRSGNRGAEYYVILGDPNAARFRGSFLLKVVTPFDVGLQRTGERVLAVLYRKRGCAGTAVSTKWVETAMMQARYRNGRLWPGG